MNHNASGIAHGNCSNSSGGAALSRRTQKIAEQTANETPGKKQKNKTGKYRNAEKANRLAKNEAVEDHSVLLPMAPGAIDLAVKVFKTSVLVFKDRARYTEGDYRFRHSCAKGNPRKVVAQWCEKEFRNLMRIKQKAKVVGTNFWREKSLGAVLVK